MQEQESLSYFDLLPEQFQSSFIRLLQSNINMTDARGNTMLHLAAAKNDTRAIYSLLMLGAHPNKKNLADKTPYSRAVEHKHGKLASILLLATSCQLSSQRYPEQWEKELTAIMRPAELLRPYFRAVMPRKSKAYLNKSPDKSPVLNEQSIRLLIQHKLEPYKSQHPTDRFFTASQAHNPQQSANHIVNILSKQESGIIFLVIAPSEQINLWNIAAITKRETDYNLFTLYNNCPSTIALAAELAAYIPNLQIYGLLEATGQTQDSDMHALSCLETWLQSMHRTYLLEFPGCVTTPQLNETEYWDYQRAYSEQAEKLQQALKHELSTTAQKDNDEMQLSQRPIISH